MNFKEYYQNPDVVNSYDLRRNRGLKGSTTRLLELRYIDYLVGSPKKQDVLEIGVGTGFISRLLVTKGKLCGMDVSREMLAKAKSSLGEIRLMRGDILNLKLKEKFDKIVTIRVISHFDKKDALTALKGISRTLNKDGELVFNLENRSGFRRLMRKLIKWGSTHTYQYSEKEVYELLSDSGFKVNEIIYLDHLFILPLHFLNKLLFDKLRGLIIDAEWKLRNIKFMSNNFLIRCQK